MRTCGACSSSTHAPTMTNFHRTSHRLSLLDSPSSPFHPRCKIHGSSFASFTGIKFTGGKATSSAEDMTKPGTDSTAYGRNGGALYIHMSNCRLIICKFVSNSAENTGGGERDGMVNSRSCSIRTQATPLRANPFTHSHADSPIHQSDILLSKRNFHLFDGSRVRLELV